MYISALRRDDNYDIYTYYLIPSFGRPSNTGRDNVLLLYIYIFMIWSYIGTYHEDLDQMRMLYM